MFILHVTHNSLWTSCLSCPLAQQIAVFLKGFYKGRMFCLNWSINTSGINQTNAKKSLCVSSYLLFSLKVNSSTFELPKKITKTGVRINVTRLPLPFQAVIRLYSGCTWCKRSSLAQVFGLSVQAFIILGSQTLIKTEHCVSFRLTASLKQHHSRCIRGDRLWLSIKEKQKKNSLMQ